MRLLFSKRKVVKSTFRHIRLTRTRWENFKDEHKLFTRVVGAKFLKDYHAFHEGFICDILDLVLHDYRIFLSRSQIREECYNAYATGFVDSISDAFHKQIAMKEFLTEFSKSDLFRSIKATLTPEEAVMQVLKILQASAEAAKQSGNVPGSSDEFDDMIGAAMAILDGINDPQDLAVMKALADKFANQNKLQDALDMQKESLAGKGTKPLQDISHLIGMVIDYHRKIMSSYGCSDLFNLSRRLEFAAKRGTGEEYERTEEPSSLMETAQLQSLSEIQNVLPTELALPNELFYLKLAKHDIQVEHNIQKIDRAMVLHILLDVSFSMKGEAGLVANAIALSFLQTYMASKDLFMMRFFDGHPKQLVKAVDLQSMHYAAALITQQGFSGGGTSINKALVAAITDIISERQTATKFSDAEILLITDGEDKVDGKNVKDILELSKIKLNTVLITGRIDKNQIESYIPLSEASSKFFDVDRNEFRVRAEDLVAQIKSEAKNGRCANHFSTVRRSESRRHIHVRR